jgi:large subunit ribosomal protein L25
MAEAVTLELQQRKTRGSNEARRLRKKGLVPGVMYGHGKGTVSVAVSAEALEKAVRHGVHVVDLQADGKTEKALIKDLQWDHLGKELLHIDFARVDVDERIVVTVPIEIRGTAPGIAAGGVLDQPMHSIAVECPVIHVPDSIRVNVSTLQLEQAIHIKELVLPADVKAMGDPDALVVQVIAKKLEEEAPVAPAAESAEPEIIGRQKAAEEDEAEEKPAGKK